MKSNDPSLYGPDAFDDAAVRYRDRIRPIYPAPLFGTTFLELTGPVPDRRLLEIDAGIGAATIGLAFAGFDVTATESDPDLAEILVRRTAHAPRITVVMEALEPWLRHGVRFPIVLVTSLSHWAPSAALLDLIAEVLPPSGMLVALEAFPIAGGNDRFAEHVRQRLRRLSLSDQPDLRLPTANQIGRRAATTGNGNFGSPWFLRRRHDVTDLAARHATIEHAYYSHQRAMPESDRADLRDIFGDLQEEYGEVNQPYLFQFCATKRLEQRSQKRVRRR